MKTKFFLIALGFVGLTSCDDIFNEDTTTADGSVPSINSQAPAQKSAYLSNQTIPVQFYVIDKDKVNELEVHVTKTGNGELAAQEVFGFRQTPNRTGVTIDTTFNAAGLTPGNYQLTVTAVDGRTNRSVQTTDFTVNNY